jgi:homer protein
LRLALVQSTSATKKLEDELHVLKNNNMRLTSALQESHSNLEEWKKQLQIYKDECHRLRNSNSSQNSSNGMV